MTTNRVDVVAMVEGLVGKRHEEWNPEEQMLALSLQEQESKRMEGEMKKLGDTHSRIKWDDFKNLLWAKGFELVLSEAFFPNHDEHEEKEKFLNIVNNMEEEFNKMPIEEKASKLVEIVKFVEEKEEEYQQNSDFYGIWCTANISLQKLKNYETKSNLNTKLEISVDAVAKEYISGYKTEEIVIYAHREKGYLLCATSYSSLGEKRVNGGKFYCQGMPKPEFLQSNGDPIRGFLYHINGDSSWKDGVRVCGKDVREGLFQYIAEIEKHMNLVSIWHDQQAFIWLLDYAQTKDENFDYHAINMERLSRCPKWVQEMVGLKARKERE